MLRANMDVFGFGCGGPTNAMLMPLLFGCAPHRMTTML
jgi:hypothetical protein